MNRAIFTWIFLPFLLLFTCGCVTEEANPWSLKPGDSLPQFSAVMSTGDTITTESLRGDVSVITFFNTECSDCQRELPIIQRHMEDNPDVKFICIAREEGAESIQKYWEANSLTLPYSPQLDRKIYSLFASSIIPRVYVVSPSLVITAVYAE